MTSPPNVDQANSPGNSGDDPKSRELLTLVQDRICALLEPASGHYVEQVAHDAVEGGKLVRPRLLMAAAGVTSNDDVVVRVAAALELIHAALLVHDDLIDGDHERRGRPTVAHAAATRAAEAGFDAEHTKRVGITTAVVTGDILMTRGLGELTRLDAPVELRSRLQDIVDRALSAAAMGEFDDVWHARTPLDEHLIRSLLERKTAEYSFRAPLEAGAILGDRSETDTRRLGSIGLRMGVLYQLRDDVLGTFGDEEATGKSVLSDLRAGAPTMLIHLVAQTPSWRDIADLWGDPTSDYASLERVRAVLEDSGALRELTSRMDTELALLRADIDELSIEHEARNELESLLVATVERKR